jgi:hypothetical protein
LAEITYPADVSIVRLLTFQFCTSVETDDSTGTVKRSKDDENFEISLRDSFERLRHRIRP